MKRNNFFTLFKKAVRGEEQDYTKGNLNDALILLAIPMILEMVMESLFAIVDVFFVAKISNEAVATVGLTESVLMLVESVAIGIAMGATALIARRIGEKKLSEANDSAIQTVILGVFVSLVTGVLAFIYAEDILRLMGGSEKLVQEGKEYTRIILSLNIILMLLFIFNGIFRAAGNPAIAMRTLWLSNGLNIVLDPIFIFGIGSFAGMGVTGAAVATCIGRGVGVMYQLYALLGGQSIIKVSPEFLRPNWTILKRLVRISAGGAGQFLISTASWIFLVRILATFGSAVLAGYTIGIRIIIFSILPSWGLSNATATLVGQNLGAHNAERAEKTVWLASKYNAIFMVTLSILFFLGANWISSFFTQEQEVIDQSSLCLRILCLGYIFFAYQMILSQAFNGAGDTYTPTLLSFVFMWLMQIPLSYYLANYLEYGPLGVYAAICISQMFMSFASIYLFRKGNWKKIKV